MADRYQRKLPGYRPPQKEPEGLPAALRLDPQRASVLLACVQRLLDQPPAEQVSVERRRAFRRPYPSAMLMTPCDDRRQPRVDETQTVVAKDLTPGSVGFVHSRALRESAIVLTFRLDNGLPICVLAAVRRVQPIRQGLYLIGAEFLERITLGELHDQAAGPRP